jgi:hypothetical protein
MNIIESHFGMASWWINCQDTERVSLNYRLIVAILLLNLSFELLLT